MQFKLLHRIAAGNRVHVSAQENRLAASGITCFQHSCYSTHLTELRFRRNMIKMRRRHHIAVKLHHDQSPRFSPVSLRQYGRPAIKDFCVSPGCKTVTVSTSIVWHGCSEPVLPFSHFRGEAFKLEHTACPYSTTVKFIHGDDIRTCLFHHIRYHQETVLLEFGKGPDIVGHNPYSLGTTASRKRTKQHGREKGKKNSFHLIIIISIDIYDFIPWTNIITNPQRHKTYIK